MNTNLIKRMNIDKLRGIVPDMECMGCGTPTSKDDIHIHHINLDPTDNRLNNLSLICRACHGAEHRSAGGGWRRSLAPIPAIAIGGKNKLRRNMTWEQRFDERFSHVGGVNEFKRLYLDDGISMAEIGIKFGVVRERVRQFAVRLNLPQRGLGFMDTHKRTHYGFPYKHRPLSNYLENNNIRPRDFADQIGKSYQMLNQYLNMIRPISATTAIEIISATKGALTVEQLMNPMGDHKTAVPA